MISQLLEQAKREWLSQNHGVIARVSRDLGVSHEYVRLVFWERSVSPKKQIENRLIELGAPGFVHPTNAVNERVA